MEASLEGHGEDIVIVAGEAWRQVWKGREDMVIVAGGKFGRAERIFL